MALWDMRKTEKITPLFDDNDLKEDVSRLEKKIDTILALLVKLQQQKKNDLNMVYASINIHAKCTFS